MAAIAIAFAGTMAALILASRLEPDWSGSEHSFALVEGLLLASAGFLALAALGFRSWNATLGRRLEGRWLALAPAVGAAGFAIAWVYVTALQALVGGDLEGAEEHIPLFSGTWLAVVCVAPLVEEWVDRGVLWIACVRANGTTMALWTTSALFALSHGLNGGWLLECPHRFAGGLLLGWLRLRSGSIAAPILAHATWNLLAVSL